MIIDPNTSSNDLFLYSCKVAFFFLKSQNDYFCVSISNGLILIGKSNLDTLLVSFSRYY